MLLNLELSIFPFIFFIPAIQQWDRYEFYDSIIIDFKKFTLSFSYSLSLENGVCFLVMTEKTFSKRSAFSYLEDIQNEFNAQYGGHVPTARRPYCFIEFGKLLIIATLNGISQKKEIVLLILGI